MLIYEFLTWLIIRLGRSRHWYLKKFYWKTGFYLRTDRDEMNKLEGGQGLLKGAGFALECCDCGLTHFIKNWEDSEDLHCIPHRPKNYKYKLR